MKPNLSRARFLRPQPTARRCWFSLHLYECLYNCRGGFCQRGKFWSSTLATA